MSDTLGSLIDKLFTVDTKMWNNQEELYRIRRMTFDEYKHEYFENEEGAKRLWSSLQKACDLNVQRNNLIDEIDQHIVTLLEDIKNDKALEEYVQTKYKTY